MKAPWLTIDCPLGDHRLPLGCPSVAPRCIWQLRIFYQQYELGEDPSKIPTGAQKATGLAILIQMKMLACALLWGQAAKPDDTGFTILQRVLVGCTAAIITLPASVFLDQLFWRAQRVTNSAPASSGKEAGVTLIARAAMHVALNNIDTQTALYCWKRAVEDLKVEEIRARLYERRMITLGLAERTANEGGSECVSIDAGSRGEAKAVSSARRRSPLAALGTGRLSRPSSARVAPSQPSPHKMQVAHSESTRKELQRHHDGSSSMTVTVMRKAKRSITFAAPDPADSIAAAEASAAGSDGAHAPNAPPAATALMLLEDVGDADLDGIDEPEMGVARATAGHAYAGAAGDPGASQPRRGSFTSASFADVREASAFFAIWRQMPAHLGMRSRATSPGEVTFHNLDTLDAAPLDARDNYALLANQPASGRLVQLTHGEVDASLLRASDAFAILHERRKRKSTKLSPSEVELASPLSCTATSSPGSDPPRQLTPENENVPLTPGARARAAAGGGATSGTRGGAAAGSTAMSARCVRFWRADYWCGRSWLCCSCVFVMRVGACIFCCRPARLQPRWLRWWLRTWVNGVRFWSVFPWLVTIPTLFGCSLLTLWVAQSVFEADAVYVLAFCEAIGISLAQSWLLQDVLVIAVRNNINCTKGRIRSHRYQVIEKFVLAPLLVVKKVFSSALVDA